MKKIYLKIFLFFLIVVQTVNKIYAQSAPPQDYISKIMPASPEAFKFGTYGNIPVGLFTGAPNINIPISTFNNGSINIPISLNYSSNGIRLDETNGSVGLGWNLITAGVITRTVRDLPDENSSSLSLVPNIDVLGLWSPDVVNYINLSQDDGADSEPDSYMANFAGNNIRFVFDKNGRPSLISKSDFQIIGESGGNSFTLISNIGVIYEFSAIERSISTSSGGVHPTPNTYNSSWFLSKVTSPDGHEVYIDYQDSNYRTTLSQSATMKYTPPGVAQFKLITDNSSGVPVCTNQIFVIPADVNSISKISSIQDLFGKQIQRIYTKDISGNIIKQMLFNYTSANNTDLYTLNSITYKSLNTEVLNYSFGYTTTSNGRLFLKNIINNKDGNKYQFEYINENSLPLRLNALGDVSLSRDLWGLYNGKANNTLIPQIFEPNDPNGVKYAGADQSFDSNYGKTGLLNKIIYPTKGSTQITYEPHVKKENQIIPGSGATYTSIGLQAVSTSEIKNVSKTVTFTPTRDEFVKVTIPSSISVGDCPPDDFHTKGNLLITENNVSRSLSTYSTSYNGYITVGGTSLTIATNMPTTEYYIQLHKNTPITFTLASFWFCTNVSFSLTYRTGDGTPDTTVQVDVPFGGFRIASTTDNPLVGTSVTRNYIYSNINVLRDSFYKELQTDRSYCGPNYNDLQYYTITSDNLRQLTATSPNIFYQNVTEEIPGKGKIIHTFDVTSDYFGKTLIGKDISSSPWTNFGWNNGKEILTTYKDNLDTKLKEVTYNYANDESKSNSVDGISVRKNYTLNYTSNVTLKCTAENVNASFEQYYCSANHTHVWWSIDGYASCHGAGHIDNLVTFYGYCYGHNIGETIVRPDIFENLDVVQYKNISRFEYLKSQTTTDFLNGKELKTTTQYFYNSPLDLQQSSQETTFPDSSVLQTSYKYAQEKGNQLLIDNNMLGVPLETTVTKKPDPLAAGKMVGKTETFYPMSQTEANTKTAGLALPVSVLSYDVQTNASSTEVTYDQYDNLGNLQQYTTKSGIPVAIIWGYNQTEPIAKIEGATYAQVSSLATALIAASNTDALTNTEASDTTFRTALDNFRKDPSMVGYQISTYSYDPLIGVKSITPPSGIREIYKYDTANRLQSVVDVNGNILKENKYNYKP